MVEHWSPKPGVVSSSLASPAKKYTMGLKTYVKESYNELVHKVSWPTWADLQSSAIVVLTATFIFALIVLVMDTTFSLLMKDFLYKIFE